MSKINNKNILVVGGMKNIKYSSKKDIRERMAPIIKFAKEFNDDELYDEIISSVSMVIDVINNPQSGYDAMSYFFTVDDEKHIIILCRDKISKTDKDKLRTLALNYDYDAAIQMVWGS